MENFFSLLLTSQFLERLKDKYRVNTDIYVFIENEIEQLEESSYYIEFTFASS